MVEDFLLYKYCDGVTTMQLEQLLKLNLNDHSNSVIVIPVKPTCKINALF
ncbi:hypothetical protein MRBBS_1820 [Marinobacter sp. BSs20148]|nr:hypothetical protein MRBBS_1820 [Marinobacter sp. BSs20148]